MNRIVKPFVVVLAGLYFLADAIFATIAHPLARWIGEQRIFARLRTWIRSLRPYPSLALFAVPLIMLEPVKPVAAYLAATSQVRLALMVLIVGEILKLVLVERLFSINRDKLLSISRLCLGLWKISIRHGLAGIDRGVADGAALEPDRAVLDPQHVCPS